MNGTPISSNFDLAAPKSIDSRTGKFSAGAWIPYVDVAEANSLIPSTRRHVGLTVLIGSPTVYVEYWYGVGITDNDLVVKVAGGNTLVVGAGEDLFTFSVGAAPTPNRTVDASFNNGTVFQFDGLIGKKIEVWAGSQRLVPETDGYQFNSTTGTIETANTQSNVNLYVIAVNPNLQLTGGGGSSMESATYTADHTLSISDLGKMVRMNSASANNLTVPPDIFSANAQVAVRCVGAGTTTIVAGSGVTLLNDAFDISQYRSGVLHCIAGNTWDVHLGGSGVSLTQLSTPGSITSGTPTATTIPFTWGAVTGEDSFVFEITTAADTGYAAIVQTLTPAANATSATFTSLTASTGYIYRGRSIGNGTTYSNSANSSSVSVTTAAASALNTLTFQNLQDTSFASTVYTKTGGGSFGGQGYSDNHLPLNGDGLICITVRSSVTSTFVGLDSTAAFQSYPTVELGFFLDGTTISVANNGIGAVVNGGRPATAGERIAVRRASGVITIEKVNANGDLLPPALYTFPGGPDNAVKVPVFVIDTTLENPQHIGLV